jgi:hypothetical protein
MLGRIMPQLGRAQVKKARSRADMKKGSRIGCLLFVV